MELIKKMIVSIEGLACSGCEQKVEEELKKLKGIKEVKADYKNKTIDLEYNLLNVNLAEIDKKIVEIGYRIPQSDYAKAERNISYRIEQNELRNFLGFESPKCAGCDDDCFLSQAKQDIDKKKTG